MTTKTPLYNVLPRRVPEPPTASPTDAADWAGTQGSSTCVGTASFGSCFLRLCCRITHGGRNAQKKRCYPTRPATPRGVSIGLDPKAPLEIEQSRLLPLHAGFLHGREALLPAAALSETAAVLVACVCRGYALPPIHDLQEYSKPNCVRIKKTNTKIPA